MRITATLCTVLLACSAGCSDGGGSGKAGGSSASSSSSGGSSQSSGAVGGQTQKSSGGSQGGGGSGGSNSSSSSQSSAAGSGGSSSSSSSSSLAGGSGGSQTGGKGGSTGGTTGRDGGTTGGSSARTGGSQTGGGTQGTGGASAGSGGKATTGGTSASSTASGGTGGSSGSTPMTGGTTGLSTADPNVVPIIIDSGLEGRPYVNGPFATVTICDPGTNTCEDIDHLLIDTGSIGLRILRTRVTVKLPAATNTNGKVLGECLPFMSGTAWGEVRMADLKIGGLKAANQRVHLIGEDTYPLPRDCTGEAINDSDSLGSNGILGIGLNPEDCGAACASKTRNPGLYYECSSSAAGGCVVAAVPVSNQLANPIVMFPSDNNGSFLQFPSIPAGGVVSQTGFMVFGIGTRPNNQLGNAKIVPVDAYGEMVTTYNGKQYNSFIDSGSNGLYFLNSTLSKFPECTTGSFRGFYCPTSTTDLTATMEGKTGNISVSFTIGNASKLSIKNAAIAELGGPLMDSANDPSAPGFDWGLPFHFGKTVFCAIEGKETPAGAGPYFAF